MRLSPLSSFLLALCLGASLSAGARSAYAQSRSTIAPERPRVIGDYAIGRGFVKITVNMARIEVVATDGDSVAMLYLDAPSVTRWLDTATTLVRSKVKTAEWTEFVTPPLRHPDLSIESRITFTREVVGDHSTLFFTALLDPTHLAVMRMSPMEARILLSAFRRAVEEVRYVQSRTTAGTR